MDSLEITASRQGQLDNLCGVYSLVNAVAYLYDGRVKRKQLKLRLLKAFEMHWPLAELLEYGMDTEQMSDLIDHVLRQGYYQKHYPLKISQPFLKIKPYRTKRLLADMQQYLNESAFEGSRIILIGTSEHWSLIKQIDLIQVYFFDSTNWQTSLRSSFSIIEGRKRHTLVPDAIFYFEREDV